MEFRAFWFFVGIGVDKVSRRVLKGIRGDFEDQRNLVRRTIIKVTFVNLYLKLCLRYL